MSDRLFITLCGLLAQAPLVFIPDQTLFERLSLSLITLSAAAYLLTFKD